MTKIAKTSCASHSTVAFNLTHSIALLAFLIQPCESSHVMMYLMTEVLAVVDPRGRADVDDRRSRVERLIAVGDVLWVLLVERQLTDPRQPLLLLLVEVGRCIRESGRHFRA